MRPFNVGKNHANVLLFSFTNTLYVSVCEVMWLFCHINNVLIILFMLELESHCGSLPNQVKLPASKKPNLAKKILANSSSEEDSSDEVSLLWRLFITSNWLETESDDWN